MNDKETEILIRQNGSSITELKTKDNFETTIYTELGMFTISYKQWENEYER